MLKVIDSLFEIVMRKDRRYATDIISKRVVRVGANSRLNSLIGKGSSYLSRQLVSIAAP